jgi:mono/diheme cytochrome c family protein
MLYCAVALRPFANVLLLVMFGAAQFAWAAGNDEPGRLLYLRYCSACHGSTGKGDGVAGSLMRPHPADLTQLASQNRGEFPIEQVMRTIDGRQALRAHGDPAMPVWGEILSEEHGGEGKSHPGVERRVHGRIFSIAEYLRTIQVK